VGLVIVSIMLVMAAIGFAFAWFTTESRRQRDRLGETSAAASSQVVSIAPAKLAALGYLPRDTDAVAGIHIAELMNQPGTAAILQLMRSDRMNFGIHRLEQLTGLRLEDLDHVVIGLKMEEADLPHIYVIVKTRFPYDEEEIRERLKAKRPVKVAEKLVYRIALEQIQATIALWCADERTLVFALHQKDLAGLPAKPIPGADRFSPQIGKYLAPAPYQAKLSTLPGQGPIMENGTEVWVVGASGKWDDTLAFLRLVGLEEADRRVLSQVRAFRGQVRCGGNVDVRIEVKCADADGASEFDKYLGNKGLDAQHLETMAQQQPQAAALLRECAQSLHPEQNGVEVFVHVQATKRSIRQALGHGAIEGRTVE
jgi:hypothetical protein